MPNPSTTNGGPGPADAAESLARKLADPECGYSLDMLVKILHSIPLAVFWKNRDGVFLGCNDVFAGWAGFESPEQLIGKTSCDLPWPPEHAEVYLAAERLTIERNEPMHHVCQPLRRADGAWLWVDASLVPLVDASGAVYAILGVYDDITTRKKGEERFSKAFEASPSPIVISRIADKQIIDVNEAFEKDFGYRREDAIGNTSLALGIWDEPEHCLRVSQLLLSQGRVRNEECRLRTKDGVLRIALVSSESLDINGEKCMLSVAADITDRKQAEERFTKIFRAIPNVAVIARMRDNSILEVNDAFEHLTGYRREEVIGRTSLELGLWDDPRHREVMLQQISGERTLHNEERRFRMRDGTTRIGLISGEPLDIGGEECFLVLIADITERRQMEEQRQVLASIVERANEVVSWAYPDGRIAFINDAGCRLFGIDSGTVAERDVYSVVPEQTRERLQNVIVPMLRRGESWEGELQCQNLKTGEVHDLHSMIFPIRDTTGEQVLLANVSLDITERKRDEKQLKFSAERSSVLLKLNQMIGASLEELTSFVLEEAVRFSQSKLGYLAFVSEDQKTMTMQAWSRTAMAECGVANAPVEYSIVESGLWGEAVRQRRPVITNDYDAPNPMKKGCPAGHVAIRRHMNIPVIVGERVVLVAGVANKEEPYDEADTQQLTLLMEGMWRMVERRRAEQELALYRDHLEDLVKQRTAELEESRKHALDLMQEANDQKQRTEEALAALQRSEEQLRQSEMDLRVSNEHLARAQAIAHVGHWAWDVATGRVTASAEYHRIRGTTPETLGSFEDMLKTVHSEDRERVAELAQAAASGRCPYNAEYRIVRPDNTVKYVRVLGEATYDAQGSPQHMFGATIDVTESKMAEARLREATLAAKAANRAKSVFLANMSHELRTPLTAVLGFSQLLRDAPTLTETQREYLDIINRSGAHLLSLINDVLDMSKIEAGQLTLHETVFDLPVVLASVEEMMRIRADAKELSFKIECAADLHHHIRTDEKKLRQILINLIGNAVKFTKKGGIVVRVRTEANGSVLRCDVEDTGPGIPEEDVPKLFDRFVQSGQDQEGVGLGLYISRKLVELMGGRISVTSALGHGACFSFEIQCQPAVVAEPQSPPVLRRVVGLTPGQKTRRVLVVEDKADTRLFIVRLLQSAGFEVEEAENGQEGVERFNARTPDIVLMDMRMPVLDGYQATREIKGTEVGKKTPVIALTASAFDEDRQKSFDAGVDDYLGKPIQVEELYEIIRNHLGVSYTYADEHGRAKLRLSRAATGKMLSALPADLLQEMRDALATLDLDEFKGLLPQVSEIVPELGEQLMRLAKGFELAKLAELLNTKRNVK